MKAVSRRIRQDGNTFFRFELRDGKQTCKSRWAVTGRVWLAVVSGVKALEFRDLDELDRLLFSLALVYQYSDLKGRDCGFRIEKEVKS